MNQYFKHSLPKFNDKESREKSKFITETFDQITQIIHNLADPSREHTLCIRNLELAHFYAQKALEQTKDK
jgi:hypothetical protein